jgi:hypothetical protein
MNLWFERTKGKKDRESAFYYPSFVRWPSGLGGQYSSFPILLLPDDLV